MNYRVKISRQEPSALFDLKGDQATMAKWAGNALPGFPNGPNQMLSANGATLYHVGRRHWLLRTAILREGALTAQLKPEAAPSNISIVRVSDILTFFDITGPEADQIMAIASPLDFHPTVFDNDCATFTTAFGIKAFVIRCDNGFEVAVEQSFSDYFSECCARSAGQSIKAK